jgi:rhamnosyltransferase
MSERGADISIILLTYNGEVYLADVLGAVFAQKTRFSYEVIAIDSGSSDRTLEIIKAYPLRLIQIPNREFGHGKTRNLGVQNATGRYVVFLTQDATPTDENWLENLVRPLVEDGRVAGAYSRQIPRSDCNPWEARDIIIGAGPVSALKRVDFEDPFQRDTYRAYQSRFISFSNVSSCIRKSVWEQLRFSEKIVMVEDQEWCKRAIESGFTVVYEASSAVYHSHNHSLKMIYGRHFDYGVSLREFAPIPMTLRNVLLYTAIEAVGDFAFILARRGDKLAAIKWIVQSPFVRFAMRYGLYRGLQGRAKLPSVKKIGLPINRFHSGDSV